MISNFLLTSPHMGTRIYMQRKAKFYTQADLAKLTGITQSLLSKYEKGTIPSRKTLECLAQHLDVSVEWLITGKSDKDTDPAGGPPDQAGDLNEIQVILGNIDSRAERFFRQYESTPGLVAEIAFNAFRAPGRYLEIGAGAGKTMMALLDKHIEIYGTEPSSRLHRMALGRNEALRGRISGWALPHVPKNDEKSWDGILCDRVLNFFKPTRLLPAVAAIIRLAKAGAPIIITLPRHSENFRPLRGRIPEYPPDLPDERGDSRSMDLRAEPTITTYPHPPEGIQFLFTCHGCRLVRQIQEEEQNLTILELKAPYW